MRRVLVIGVLVLLAVSSVPSVGQQAAVTETAPTTYYIQSQANLRTCPERNCKAVILLPQGSPITVDGTIRGEKVSGENGIWYRVEYDGETAYVYSGAVTKQPISTPRPAATRTPATRTPGGTTRVPASTAVPSGATCGGARTCGAMTSCDQAYACLKAGNGRLDKDGDGVPCESICPGG